MAIDDPVGVLIQQARDASEAESYLPPLLIKHGMSALVAVEFAKWPFVANLITGLLMSSRARLEERLLTVSAELHAQQLRIEDKISDKEYYKSEEFQTLLILILEKLHSTHQEEKLRMFGDALANSGSSDFREDDREQYIRTLRDLSLEDLRLLRSAAKLASLPEPFRNLTVKDPGKPSMARLTGLGLIDESHRLKKIELSIPTIPSSAQSIDVYVRAMTKAFSSYFQKAPVTIYQISKFGERFLSFISEEDTLPKSPAGPSA